MSAIECVDRWKNWIQQRTFYYFRFFFFFFFSLDILVLYILAEERVFQIFRIFRSKINEKITPKLLITFYVTHNFNKNGRKRFFSLILVKHLFLFLFSKSLMCRLKEMLCRRMVLHVADAFCLRFSFFRFAECFSFFSSVKVNWPAFFLSGPADVNFRARNCTSSHRFIGF